MNQSHFKFLILAGLIFLLSSLTTYAQSKGTITGKVIEATSGTPLVGANVMLGSSQGASADIQGNYTITGVEPGNYQISASFLGYEEEIKETEISIQN